ncbi:hypothetical protein [Roseovarius nanhaiticus]|uniref:DUF1127 domain-containing protein n=1 Tax=Roseovarius nanhaiticus TaxID=573024 RepID=A0A1N7GX35_9RHOB|nr:hypothetical protein [Roseovarius nanhaiticus]SEL20993.1 hypothetical protein SAMN05216208_3137 [Roseovarius nanhaiticus]SIS17163.1 hypothetical protein SAMN05421666_2182 [Roseovarius nanhaiticus]
MASSLRSAHPTQHATDWANSAKTALVALGTGTFHAAIRAMRGVEERRVRQVLHSMNDRQLAAIGIDRAGIPAYAASITTAEQMHL